MSRAALITLLALPLVTGCMGTLRQVQVVKEAVPIPCQAQEPERPAMPTGTLRPGVSLDRFVKAAAAEIEVREAYELQLRTALSVCIAPLGGPP